MINNEKLLPEHDTIEKLFNFYLEKVELMHLDKESTQYSELKRAFYGSAGAVITLIGELSDEDVPEAIFNDNMDALTNEISAYWYKEALKHQKNETKGG